MDPRFRNFQQGKPQNSPQHTFVPKNAPQQHRPDNRPADDGVDLEEVLKRVALFFGFALLILSIFFSYDGFDQRVTGGNTDYSTLSTLIGILMAVVVTVVEFIFNTDHKHLNGTLIVAGLVAYAYSIWTNYSGILHLLHTDPITAGIMAVFMDVLPETMISWALDSSLKGDLIGNIMKSAFGTSKKQKRQYNYEVSDDLKHRIGH